MRETHDIYRYALNLLDHAPDGCIVTIATTTIEEQPVTFAMGCAITNENGQPVPRTCSRYVNELAAVQACRAAHTELAAVLTKHG